MEQSTTLSLTNEINLFSDFNQLFEVLAPIKPAFDPEVIPV